MVQNLVSNLSGSLVPEALESREDGRKVAKMEIFQLFWDLFIFNQSSVHKTSAGHFRSLEVT